MQTAFVGANPKSWSGTPRVRQPDELKLYSARVGQPWPVLPRGPLRRIVLPTMAARTAGGEDSDRAWSLRATSSKARAATKIDPDAGCVTQMTHPDAYVDMVEQFVSFS